MDHKKLDRQSHYLAEIIKGLSGCDGSDDYAKGWDDACKAILQEIGDLMEEGIKKEECIKKQEEPERLIKEIHEIQKVIDHRTAVEKKVIKLIGECRFQEAMDLLSEDMKE